MLPMLEQYPYVVASEWEKHLYYFQCFFVFFLPTVNPTPQQPTAADDNERAINDANRQNMRWICCSAFERASSNIAPSTFPSQQCLREFTLVPTVRAEEEEDAQRGWQQVGAFLLDHTQPDDAAIPTNNGKSDTTTNSTWKHYVWDDSNQKGLWMEHLVRHVLDTRLSYDFYRWVQSLDSAQQERPQISATLHPEGGMHRKLQYSIAQQSNNATFVLHLPSEYFVNVEDALEEPSDVHCAQLIADSVIDQEEPSFTSPQHAIRIHLTNTTTNAQFNIRLHQRYVKPLVKGGLRRVYVLPVVSKGLPWTPPQGTWVGAGDERDTIPVLWCTLLVALLGTIIMWRSISKVARWE